MQNSINHTTIHHQCIQITVVIVPAKCSLDSDSLSGLWVWAEHFPFFSKITSIMAVFSDVMWN